MIPLPALVPNPVPVTVKSKVEPDGVTVERNLLLLAWVFSVKAGGSVGVN